MVGDGPILAVGKTIEQGSITWDGGSVPIPSTFFNIKRLDDLSRPVTVIFAPWDFHIDHVAWWQMVTFITYFGVSYSILLIESARRANKLTFAQMSVSPFLHSGCDSDNNITSPIIFSLAAQLGGIGVVGQFYYFMHYISNFKASDMRLTDLSYTRSVLPARIVSYYVPHFQSFFHPSMAVRHDRNWIWQMLPLWVTLAQQVLKRTVMQNTVEHDCTHNPARDPSTIRFSIGACMAFSAGVWLYTLTMSPYSPITTFIS